MAFNVRIFGYNGLSQMHVSQQRRFAADTVWMAEEPPVWSAVAVSNGSTPVPIVFPGPGTDTARVLGIEVPDNCQIRYELQRAHSAKRLRLERIINSNVPFATVGEVGSQDFRLMTDCKCDVLDTLCGQLSNDDFENRLVDDRHQRFR